MSAALQALLDRQACVELIQRFAMLNDAGDFEALAQMFVEEGSFARPSAPDAPVQGREAILAAFRQRPPRLTRHVVGNIVVDLDGDDRATARSYIVLYAGAASDAPPPVPCSGPVLVGEFDDVLVKRDGQWRFLSRRGALALQAG